MVNTLKNRIHIRNEVFFIQCLKNYPFLALEIKCKENNSTILPFRKIVTKLK